MGVERQGLRFSLSHIAVGEWLAVFTGETAGAEGVRRGPDAVAGRAAGGVARAEGDFVLGVAEVAPDDSPTIFGESSSARGLLVAPNDDAVRLAQDNLSLWLVVGIGTAIAAFGLLLLVLRPLCARLLRRRIFAGRAGSTRDGFEQH